MTYFTINDPLEPVDMDTELEEEKNDDRAKRVRFDLTEKRVERRDVSPGAYSEAPGKLKVANNPNPKSILAVSF